MKPVRVSLSIAAPLELVFQTIADPLNFCDAVPHITNIEFLSEKKKGVGTRFRETRVMKGRESTVDLEVTEYVENDRVRMISDAGGTIWDSIFTLTKDSGKIEMKMQMDILPHTLIARITTPLIWKMVASGVEKDMDVIKDYCESKV